MIPHELWTELPLTPEQVAFIKAKAAERDKLEDVCARCGGEALEHILVYVHDGCEDELVPHLMCTVEEEEGDFDD